VKPPLIVTQKALPGIGYEQDYLVRPGGGLKAIKPRSRPKPRPRSHRHGPDAYSAANILKYMKEHP